MLESVAVEPKPALDCCVTPEKLIVALVTEIAGELQKGPTGGAVPLDWSTQFVKATVPVSCVGMTVRLVSSVTNPGGAVGKEKF